MFQRFQQFASDESGATLIEYGLIVALVCVTAISGISALGNANEGGLKKTFIDTIIPALSGSSATD